MIGFRSDICAEVGRAMLDRFHIIKHPLGGSDVYDSSGKQVGYSLPSVFGDGEDFYDMDGNPVGQSFDDSYGMSDFIGVRNGSYGCMDQEIIMGRNAWLHGDPYQKEDSGLNGLGGMYDFGSNDDDFGSEPGMDDSGLDG